MEPVEEVLRNLREDGFALSAEDFLTTMFALFSRDFITIWQAPLPAFGQAFPERVITPSQPSDIVGEP